MLSRGDVVHQLYAQSLQVAIHDWTCTMVSSISQKLLFGADGILASGGCIEDEEGVVLLTFLGDSEKLGNGEGVAVLDSRLPRCSGVGLLILGSTWLISCRCGGAFLGAGGLASTFRSTFHADLLLHL